MSDANGRGPVDRQAEDAAAWLRAHSTPRKVLRAVATRAAGIDSAARRAGVAYGTAAAATRELEARGLVWRSKKPGGYVLALALTDLGRRALVRLPKEVGA